MEIWARSGQIFRQAESSRPNRDPFAHGGLLFKFLFECLFFGGWGPTGGGDFLEAESKQGSKWQTMAVSCARRPTVDERSETE